MEEEPDSKRNLTQMQHRERFFGMRFLNSEPMPNWKKHPRGIEAILKENYTLVKKGVWDTTPLEWGRVSSEAGVKGEVVHRARVFGLATIKGSDLPEAEQKVNG